MNTDHTVFGWQARYRIGVLLNKHLDPVCTLDELGAELGITRQNAYTESVLALGKFAVRLFPHAFTRDGRLRDG
jgi:hypothetical protein